MKLNPQLRLVDPAFVEQLPEGFPAGPLQDSAQIVRIHPQLFRQVGQPDRKIVILIDKVRARAR